MPKTHLNSHIEKYFGILVNDNDDSDHQ